MRSGKRKTPRVAQTSLAKRGKPATQAAKPASASAEYVLETIPGMESVAAVEIREHLFTPPRKDEPGVHRLHYAGKPERLLALRATSAVFRTRLHPVARPMGLLGHQYFTAIVADMKLALSLHPAGAFETLRLAAAGRDTAVMARLAGELAKAVGLAVDTSGDDEKTLLVRLRPQQKKVEKPARRISRDETPPPDEYVTLWESLVSLTPRPLSTRAWRVANYPGAVNACAGYAMARLAGPAERFINLCAGSGTILIERQQSFPCKEALGCDTSVKARDAAAANGVVLEDWDATKVLLEDGWADVVVSDLPFGQRIGTHADNVKLYPALLAEAARLTHRAGRAVFLTHEIKLFEQTLDKRWEVERVLTLTLGGMHPRLYVLVRQ